MIERLLAAFQAHAVPRVYGFVNGGRGEQDGAPPGTSALEAVLRRWVAAGHPVGNHTWSHINLLKVSLPEYLADIERNEPLLERLMAEAAPPARGLSWKMFRYPFLFEGDTVERHHAVRAYLGQRGYTVAEVTIDAEDWAFNGPFARCVTRGDRAALEILRERLVAAHVDELRRMRELTWRLEGREVPHVLLLHAGVADADAVEALLTAYEREGVRWIDLPTALADRFYAQDPAQPARFGAAFPYLVARARQMTFPPSALLPANAQMLAAVCPGP